MASALITECEMGGRVEPLMARALKDGGAKALIGTPRAVPEELLLAMEACGLPSLTVLSSASAVQAAAALNASGQGIGCVFTSGPGDPPPLPPLFQDL
eukprot:SAG11_NODE_18127_length_499_cov_0.890000_1_plen_98_part_00